MIQIGAAYGVSCSTREKLPVGFWPSPNQAGSCIIPVRSLREEGVATGMALESVGCRFGILESVAGSPRCFEGYRIVGVGKVESHA